MFGLWWVFWLTRSCALYINRICFVDIQWQTFFYFFFINFYRSLCSTLLSAQINLLAYFQCLMELLPENQRIEIGKNSKMHFSVKGRTFIASNENSKKKIRASDGIWTHDPLWSSRVFIWCKKTYHVLLLHKKTL